jgi:hypothetical protein
MSTLTATVALDLTKTPPRSPNALLGPYIILARTIDKARATHAGTQGGYHWDCPLGALFFDFKGVNRQGFFELIKAGKTDDEILAWVEATGQPKTEDEVLAWSYQCRTWAPEAPEKQAYFERCLRALNRPELNIASFSQLLDAEEGRL